jgi:hypothetical protein
MSSLIGNQKFTGPEIDRIRDELGEAIRDLQVFLDPNNPDCNVSPEARQAAAEYLYTWVLGPIQTADQLIASRVGRNETKREEQRTARKRG